MGSISGLETRVWGLLGGAARGRTSQTPTSGHTRESQTQRFALKNVHGTDAALLRGNGSNSQKFGG